MHKHQRPEDPVVAWVLKSGKIIYEETQSLFDADGKPRGTLTLETAQRSEYTAIAQHSADFYATAAEEAKARFKAEEQKYYAFPPKKQLEAVHAARAAHEDAQKDASRTAEYLRRWSAFAARGH
jgi:hypothetical protein